MMRRKADAVINVRLTGVLCTVASLIAMILPMAKAIAEAHPWTRIAVPLVAICGAGVAMRFKVFAFALGGALGTIASIILVAGLRHFNVGLFIVQILAIGVLMAPVVALYRNRSGLR
jgi:hypothetical protein